jgi:excisionase family DNA binding protein
MNDSLRFDVTPFHDAAALPEQLTPREAADFLRVGLSTMYGLLQRGELAHTRIGRAIRIAKGEVLGRRGGR